MHLILPDAYSLHRSQLDYEPQYVKELAGDLQQQQDADDPQRDAEQEEGNTPDS